MSYYQAQRLRRRAGWVRRLGYITLPIILFVSAAAARGEPDSTNILLNAALIAVVVVASTEALGWLLDKRADQQAKR
jgi:hypothetical protein